MVEIKFIFLIYLCEITTNDLLVAERVDRILKSMSCFKIIKKENYFLPAAISNESIITIKIDNEENCFSNIKLTDVYPILYGVLSYYAVCQEKLLIHSAVVYNGKKTIMLLGDFGSGKTFLSLQFRNEKWKIISADQSLINIDNDKWFILDGSTYMKIENNSEILNFKQYPVKLDNIAILRGMASNGDPDISRIENKSLIRKKIAYALMWQYVTPLTNGKIFDFKYTDFCNRICLLLSKLESVPTYFVRGDAEKCKIELERRIRE